jgi:hypothetical protein
MDISALKQDWTGFEFDTAKFEVTEQQILDFACSCGETAPRFTDPTDAEFQAPATFTSKFSGRRILPDDFPKLSKRGFDAGKCVQWLAPVRPGDTLIGSSTIHDIYEKTGRSGSMIFIVHRMEFRNQSDEVVSIVDWRMVQQP